MYFVAIRITHSHGPLTLVTTASQAGSQESDGNIKHSLLKISLASRRSQLTMAKTAWLPFLFFFFGL